MRALLFGAWVATFAGGCSLLIDTDPYQMPQDGGVDPNGPSAPEVRITPESPVTTDDLTMEIVTESVDPLGAGPVTYTIEWQRDGEDAGISEATVPASATAKGEAWVVRVIPTSADGTRTGAAGTATVTIGNLPPSIGYVGLADYRPLEGDTIESFTGPIVDPDGDLTSYVYEWLLDGEPIAGAVGPRLTLAPSMTPGARISLRVTPRDADDAVGETLQTGEAIILEDVTRWRQLQPDVFYDEGGWIVLDPERRRALAFYRVDRDDPSDIRVWEYALEPLRRRWVELHPTGTAPDFRAAASVLDARNDRILFFQAFDEGATAVRIFSFDLTTRGGESWQELTVGGDVPANIFWPALTYDAEREQILFYMITPEPPSAELRILDVSRPGFEAWSLVPLPSAELLVGSTVLIDEERDRALFLGGFTLGSGMTAVPLDTIYTLDLTNPSEGLVLAGQHLLGTSFVATAISDPERDRGIFAWGASEFGDVRPTEIYAIDYETLEVTELTPSGTPPAGGVFGQMEFDPYEPGRILVHPGAPTFDGSGSTRRFDIYSADAETLEFEALFRQGIDAPQGLDRAIGGGDRSLLFFGGIDGDYDENDELWTYDRNAGWRLVAMTPDGITGRAPAPRHGVNAGSQSFYGMTFVSGVDNATLLDSTAWTVRLTSDDEGEWIERTLLAGSPAPSPREGASMFPARCYRREVGMFGGRSEMDGMTNQVWLLDCEPAEVRNCTWVQLPLTGAQPEPRHYATSSQSEYDLILFGGRGNFGAMNDVWTLDPCEDPPAWQPHTPSGTAPSPRGGHTMVQTEDGFVVAGVRRWLIFGGSEYSFAEDPSAEVFELIDESGSYRWELVMPASGPNDALIDGRSGHVAVWQDEGGDRAPRMLVFGGDTSGFVRSDVWELRFPAD